MKIALYVVATAIAATMTSMAAARTRVLSVSVTERVSGGGIKAQKRRGGSARPLDQVPMQCEGAAARLDFAVIDTRKLEGAYLIIIARLGTGETLKRLNSIRLAVTREYILRTGADLKYVLAEGERVTGLGRLEVYVGGRLKELLPFKRNARGFCLPGSV